MLSKYFILWIPMIVIAFANATFRQLVFIKYTNELRAHQLSTLTLVVLCSIYVWLIFSNLHVQTSADALLAGGLWVILTVLFEFTLGFLTGRSLPYMLHDYDLSTGRIWPLFLFWLFLLPFLNYVIRK